MDTRQLEIKMQNLSSRKEMLLKQSNTLRTKLDAIVAQIAEIDTDIAELSGDNENNKTVSMETEDITTANIAPVYKKIKPTVARYIERYLGEF